jgi:hypothetical protein
MFVAKRVSVPLSITYPMWISQGSNLGLQVRGVGKKTQTEGEAWLLDNPYIMEKYKEEGREMDRLGG